MVGRFMIDFVRRAALGCGAVACLAVVAGITEAQAQYNSIGRGPSYNMGPRLPTINTGPGPRYAPGLTIQIEDDDPPPPRRRAPAHYLADPPPGELPPPPPSKKAGNAGGSNARFVPKELVIEVDGTPSDAQVAELAARFRLTRLESQPFPLTGTTLFRWRIPDGRSVQSVASAISASGAARATPNFRYRLQQTAAAAAPAPVDPARYPLLKLRLAEAHAVARGSEVTVAVIDSGIDARHPELDGAVSASYDPLNSKEGPHSHGTGIAGAIASHSRLLGSAPGARLLAIRAFAMSGGSTESTSFSILKSLDFAVARGARVINMSFAGPEDPMLERALLAAAGKGVVLVAAAGNAGPSSPPLYPAAYRTVIAVSATDSADRLFAASNRGKHIAVAAPGVDLVLPSPEGKYQVTSGTSFAAAYVSGLAALMIERNPSLTPDGVRAKLTATARDLGPKGPDEQFGAGLADAVGALAAAGDGAPVTAASTGAAAR